MRLDHEASDAIEIRDQSGDPFTAVWNWLLDRRDLSGTEKLVWIALRSYAGFREIRPSVQSVARRAGVSIRTAQRTVVALTGKGLLRVERRSRPDGGFATNRYTLLPSPPPQREITETRRQPVTCPPGVMVTPPPGDTLTSPQVPQRHHIEKIKPIKKTTTTPCRFSRPERRDDSVIDKGAKETSRRDIIDEMLRGTVLAAANPTAVARAAKKYRRNTMEVAVAIDALDQQYRKSQRPIEDPTSLITAVLKDGMELPRGYVSRAQRDAEAAARRETGRKAADKERRAREAGEKAYRQAKAQLSSLSDAARECLFESVKAKLPQFLRRSRRAVEALAIELIARSGAPAGKEYPDEMALREKQA